MLTNRMRSGWSELIDEDNEMSSRLPYDSWILPIVLILLLVIQSLGRSTVPYASISSFSRPLSLTFETDSKIYPPKLRKDFDERFNITSYFSNERVLRLFVRCLFYGDICDIVGQWTKPRLLQSLLGDCRPLCTTEQKHWPETILQLIGTKFPGMYRPMVGRFLEYMGIQIPKAERRLVKESFEYWESNMKESN